MYSLKEKVAFVSGASSGLGADAARAYAEQGARLVLVARRLEKLHELAAELKASYGTEALVYAADVSNEDQVKIAVYAAVEKFGRIDILLNNAGVAVPGGVHQLSVEDWQRAMDVNVKGLFLTSKYVVPQMIRQNYGKIVNISSVNARIADKEDIFIRHSYNTSKSAVLGLTLGMAASYGKYNITVNAIGPGLFETEMTSQTLFKSEAFLKSYNHQCPLGRPGRIGELNGTILYFSSDASSYVTGQYVIVDGGTSLV